MHIALFEPDIPQNTAAILRTAVCLGADVHIVGPAAFDVSDRAMRRSGLDYAARAVVHRHVDFAAFRAATARIVLFTTRAETAMHDFAFQPRDTLLFGRESAGVPQTVHAACSNQVRIAITGEARSLNLAVSVAIGLSHALTQTSQWSDLT